LQAGESGPPALLRNGVGVAGDPRRGIRDPEVEDLARAHHVVERAHDLLDRREEIPRVQPVDVDVVGAQPPQALLEVLHEALAVVTTAIRIVRVEGQGILRAEHELFTPARQELAEELFTGAVHIIVGGIDEVSAAFGETLENCTAGSFVRTQARSSPNVGVPRHSADTRSPVCPNNFSGIARS
jgi:hypothetical protein